VFLLRTKQSGGKLLPQVILRESLFLEEISHKTNYNKKDSEQKQKEQHSYKTETWNVRTLSQEGKLDQRGAKIKATRITQEINSKMDERRKWKNVSNEEGRKEG
jgi:hypothetical protein